MSVLPSRHGRRRRRSHGSAVQRTPEHLRLRRRRRRSANWQEVLACGAVSVVCAALIALIWINTVRAVRVQADDTRSRAETMVKAEAAILAEEARRELQGIEQSLTILQSAWNTDPEKFDLSTWRSMLPALTGVADDIFVANEKHVIVQDIIPQAVGQGIGSAYANFANGSLEPILAEGDKGRRDTSMLVGELGAAGSERQYVMYLVHALDKPPGWLIGASYKSSALAAVFSSAALGMHGVGALVDMRRGGVQAVVGTAALRPRLSVNNTPMYAAMQARPDGGVWTGPTAIDGVTRILAFRRVPGRDLMVLIGVGVDEAMAPADNWAAGARSVAAVATLVVLVIGGIVIWEVWHLRATIHRRRVVAQAEDLVAALQTERDVARSRADQRAAQVRALLDGASEGIAVIDRELRLAAWNARFTAASGLAAGTLHEGLPLDELLRLQAAAGWSGALDDVEAEVARRVTELRSAHTVKMPQTGLDDAPITLRVQAMPDGGLVLILGGAPAPLPVDIEVPAATEEV